MTDRITAAIAEILRARGRDAVTADTLLGEGGLALDSIAIVEVLLECEERFGVSMAAELLAGEPLTVSRIAAHVAALQA